MLEWDLSDKQLTLQTVLFHWLKIQSMQYTYQSHHTNRTGKYLHKKRDTGREHTDPRDQDKSSIEATACQAKERWVCLWWDCFEWCIVMMQKEVIKILQLVLIRNTHLIFLLNVTVDQVRFNKVLRVLSLPPSQPLVLLFIQMSWNMWHLVCIYNCD